MLYKTYSKAIEKAKDHHQLNTLSEKKKNNHQSSDSDNENEGETAEQATTSLHNVAYIPSLKKDTITLAIGDMVCYGDKVNNHVL